MFAILAMLLVACAPGPGDGVMEAQATGRTLVYECGEFEFVVRTGPGEVALYLPDDYRVLGQVRSASGARYEDGDAVFWSKDEEASLDLGRRKYRGCALNRGRGPWEDARRRGVDFRAVGQEPGWVLEIRRDDTMLMEADYGSRRVLLATPEPKSLENGENYEVAGESHEMKVEIRFEHCADIMSGQAFSSSVSVELDGRRYEGCGEALEPR
jgi:putative lipoprotein